MTSTVLSSGDTIMAGAVLLSVIAIAGGGSFLLRVVGGSVPTNELQDIYFRAGHANARLDSAKRSGTGCACLT